MANLMAENLNKNLNPTHDMKNKFSNGPIGNEPFVERASHQLGERVGAMASDLADGTAESLRRSRDYVKSNPAQGVAIAAAAGLITGSLLTLAMRRRRA